MMNKHSEFILLGIIMLVALIGLFFILTGEINNFDVQDRSWLYAEHATTSAQQFFPFFGGRGRRYVEDAG